MNQNFETYQTNWVIKALDGSYLTLTDSAKCWTKSLAQARIFGTLEEAEKRRNYWPCESAEVFELRSDTRPVPRTFPFDMTLHVLADNQQEAKDLLKRVVDHAMYANSTEGHVVSVTHKGDETGDPE